jgi:hypothetical protein
MCANVAAGAWQNFERRGAVVGRRGEQHLCDAFAGVEGAERLASSATVLKNSVQCGGGVTRRCGRAPQPTGPIAPSVFVFSFVSSASNRRFLFCFCCAERRLVGCAVGVCTAVNLYCKSVYLLLYWSPLRPRAYGTPRAGPNRAGDAPMRRPTVPATPLGRSATTSVAHQSRRIGVFYVWAEGIGRLPPRSRATQPTRVKTRRWRWPSSGSGATRTVWQTCLHFLQ